MDQFRQIGEVIGSLKALMVLKHDIPVNQRQCCLLYDMFVSAFDTISEEIRQNLRFEERNTKWKVLEFPMKELHKIFKEGESYIRYCLDVKDLWGKAISLHMNRECVEFHIHNLLSCFLVVIEAIETAAEISGADQEDMQKKRAALMKKYDEEWNDPKLFQWMFGKQYLVSREICKRLDSAWREDRWLLAEKIREKRSVARANMVKHEQKLGDLLLKKLSDTEPSSTNLPPAYILVGSSDYYVKRRLGSGGSHFKEIHWWGENFALRTFYGDIEPLKPEISLVLSLSHPNILQYHCAFYDEERKEGYLVMELMNRDISAYIKENSGQRKRNPLSIPAAVDIMLQIARGMEYLHSKKVYHGELNPTNILMKSRNMNVENTFQVKVSGYGLTDIRNYTVRSPKPNVVDPVIWYAPEVLAEQELCGRKCTMKYTEKADVYSFGMLCFELLTGKVPFEDSHLQGEKVARNIRAGERPLFPYPSPKYLANLTKRCWQENPDRRPTFSSICRILRYIKKTLVINPDHGQPDCPPPLVDYCDMEAGYLNKFPDSCAPPVSEIPFQMFAYKLVENEKICGSSRVKSWPSSNEGSGDRPASMCDDDHLATMDDLFLGPSDLRSVCSEIIQSKNSAAIDQRSVISEIPQRKLFSSDQRSSCSESPDGRYPSAPAVDQRPTYAATPERKPSFKLATGQNSPIIQTPERKFLPGMTNQKPKLELPEKLVFAKAAEKLASPRTSKGKVPLSTVTEQDSQSSQGQDNKLLSSRTPVENKTVSFGPSEGKMTPRTVEPSLTRTNSRLADIPEKKTLIIIETNPKPIASEPQRRSDSSFRKETKSSSSKHSGKHSSISQKLKDMIKTKTSRGSAHKNSPSSSPARMNRTDISTPASPARVKKANQSPPSPPRSPSATIQRTYSSPAASPARVTKSCSSPRLSSMYPSREYSSPRSSPLNPSFRGPRYGRESLVASGMSPRRPRMGHVSDTEIV